MEVLRVTEAEFVRDVRAVLARVRDGAEVIVEQDHRPVAMMSTPPGRGRSIGECIALAEAYELSHGAVAPDPGFADDVQAAVAAHSEPLMPPEWD